MGIGSSSSDSSEGSLDSLYSVDGGGSVDTTGDSSTVTKVEGGFGKFWSAQRVYAVGVSWE